MVWYSSNPAAQSEVHVLGEEEGLLEGAIAAEPSFRGPAAGFAIFRDGVTRSVATGAAMRLARIAGVRYALCGLPFAGAAAVFRDPGDAAVRAACATALASKVAGLGDTSIAYLGTTVAAGCVNSRRTCCCGASDPSPDRVAAAATARSVFVAMQLAAQARLKRAVGECTIAIQGVGSVGSILAEMLAREGAKLVIADTDSDAAARVAVSVGADIVGVRTLRTVRADIYAPCSPDWSWTMLPAAAAVVCGSAERRDVHAEALGELTEVLLVPEFIADAGAAIAVLGPRAGWSATQVARCIDAGADRLAAAMTRAQVSGTSTWTAAIEMAEDRRSDCFPHYSYAA